ncbi:hypothetical protein SLEP1_g15537 [Rubroshorea leprosula]|uniref:Uncharacterized protein n=1 Tax=Rubroshorea leprosula TaxID=152421 RepID=A0AAV5IMP0_9ROSI|nr:hypothetical protein SLEP1_g15537 [Rubroshorea leprosula]
MEKEVLQLDPDSVLDNKDYKQARRGLDIGADSVGGYELGASTTELGIEGEGGEIGTTSGPGASTSGPGK